MFSYEKLALYGITEYKNIKEAMRYNYTVCGQIKDVPTSNNIMDFDTSYVYHKHVLIS